MSEHLGSGLAAWRMPVAELEGNSAWLELACLAAQISCSCREIIIQISAAHRWYASLVAAHQKPRT